VPVRRTSNLVGERLPTFRLGEAPTGRIRSFPINARDALILLLVPEDAERWLPYVRGLNRRAEDVTYWYARIMLAVAGSDRAAADLKRKAAPDLIVLADPERFLDSRLGCRSDAATVLVVDRYGQIYDVVEADRPEDLPDAAELEEWTRFLATQCPECGVPDEPGHGDWALGVG
jgi:hypothetical protein